MGDDPVTSVVDSDLRVHESPNLYALGSAVFVTGGAANPTLTIVALAHRLAERLAGR
jgi:choline dehydrogenase-like flavoprotein